MREPTPEQKKILCEISALLKKMDASPTDSFDLFFNVRGKLTDRLDCRGTLDVTELESQDKLDVTESEYQENRVQSQVTWCVYYIDGGFHFAPCP